MAPNIIPQDSNPLNSQMMADSSPLLSLPSQPPDIRNWFSSYEYESPASDVEDDDFKGFASENLDRGELENVERFENRKDPNPPYSVERIFGEFTTSQRSMQVLEQKSHFINKDTHLPEIREVPPRPKSLLSRRLGEDDHCQDQSLRKFNLIPVAVNENSSINNKVSPEKLDGKYFRKEDRIVSKTNRSSSKDNGYFPKDFIAGKDLKEVKDLQTNLNLKVANGSNVKEEGRVVANDGFISTKSSRTATANGGSFATTLIPMQPLAGKCLTSQEAVFSENDGKLRQDHVGGSCQKEFRENSGLILSQNDKASICERQVRVGRAVLSDRTNFHAEETMLEIPGKWKCPQKGKPYIGPPLKQLRLERWVRRAQ
ncbi:uncharacterized protein LOC131233617 [Magnolia sinica]|uniref:uncharacterized protein LOC131233617 n=1 Tax=Magnolia sinica TaxID=86752 RepID=UPI002657BF93|nr:uncharacterized protein LOC131233617 [Magnolia sinica]